MKVLSLGQMQCLWEAGSAETFWFCVVFSRLLEKCQHLPYSSPSTPAW